MLSGTCPAACREIVVTKKKANLAPQVEAPPDPREALAPTAQNLKATLAELDLVLKDLPPPAEPKQLDFIEAVLHLYFADGLPCGYGQEARRRIAEGFVDRNEFRVTEAFEVEDLLSDLQIPGLFDRCLAVRNTVAQIYGDQNGVHLTFLREAGIADRNMFFQRVPAMQPHVAAFLTNLLTLEELCFSDKSTLRAQQRLSLDPKDAEANEFLNTLRATMKPYGHLPIDVGPHLGGRKPNCKHTLSPACVLARIAPAGKRRG